MKELLWKNSYLTVSSRRRSGADSMRKSALPGAALTPSPENRKIQKLIAGKKHVNGKTIPMTCFSMQLFYIGYDASVYQTACRGCHGLCRYVFYAEKPLPYKPVKPRQQKDLVYLKGIAGHSREASLPEVIALFLHQSAQTRTKALITVVPRYRDEKLPVTAQIPEHAQQRVIQLLFR